MADLREAVAHAATPWEWRSRAAVVALVVTAGALTLAMALSAFTDDVSNKAVWALVWVVVGALVFVRPAIRSLRRWDHAHGDDHAVRTRT